MSAPADTAGAATEPASAPEDSHCHGTGGGAQRAPRGGDHPREAAASDPTASSPTASGGGLSGPEQVAQTSETSDPMSALDGATSTPEQLVAVGAPDAGAPSDLSSSTEALLGSPEARPRAVRMASPRSRRRSVTPPRQPGNRRRANSGSSIRPWSREDSRSVPRPRRSSTRAEWLVPASRRRRRAHRARHASVLPGTDIASAIEPASAGPQPLGDAAATEPLGHVASAVGDPI